jgi:ribonuclease HII
LTLIAGVDEAGRGPLAGPVVAAAVVFPAEWIPHGLPEALQEVNDSKQLSARKREVLYAGLISRPEIRFGIVEVLLQDGAVREVRRLPNTFALFAPYRHG